MSGSPILVVHICCGVLGCLSGAAALVFRKGSQAHVWAGRIFVATMLIMASAGVYLAIAKSRPGDVLGGALTLYLVATSWAIASQQRKNQGAPLLGSGSRPPSLLAISECQERIGTPPQTLPFSHFP
jgi:hypothetical protein